MRNRVYLGDYKLFMRETEILQFPFISQQALIFLKHRKQFIKTCGRRNIITKTYLFCTIAVGLETGLETLASTLEFLPLSYLEK